MQLFEITLQFLFVIQSVLIIDSFFIPKFFKSSTSRDSIIAAKYDEEMPLPVRKALEKDGNREIIRIQLGRTPVKAILTFFLDLLSAGKFKRKTMELGYDEIFHNYLLVTINISEQIESITTSTVETTDESTNSKVYVLEKAQRIRLRPPTDPDEFADTFEIPLTSNKILTLNRLITTASNIDQNFYSYDAANNNMCQTFVENIVDLNGLSVNIVDNATRVALKPQDATALIATLNGRKDIVKKITDLGGAVDRLIHDKQIKLKAPPPKKFHLMGNMHVKTVEDETNEAVQKVQGNTVVIDGSADIVIENSDDAYKAVRAMEEKNDENEDDDSNESAQQQLGPITKAAIIIGCVLFVLLVSVIVYIFWQKRKNAKVIEKISQDAISHESSTATEVEQ